MRCINFACVLYEFYEVSKNSFEDITYKPSTNQMANLWPNALDWEENVSHANRRVYELCVDPISGFKVIMRRASANQVADLCLIKYAQIDLKTDPKLW